MLKTSNLVRGALAAASFLIAGSALAEGTWQPEIGWGQIAGGAVYRDNSGYSNRAPSIDLAFGYRWDNGLGIRALYIGAVDPFKDFLVESPARSFNDFDGVQATGNFSLANKLDLTAGLGLGRTSLNHGQAGDHRELLEPVGSAGLRYQFFSHFALELKADYLARTHEHNVALMAEIPF